jgi:hypothetical protein
LKDILKAIIKQRGNDIYHTQAVFRQGGDGIVICNKNYTLATKLHSAECVNQHIAGFSIPPK